MVLPVRRRPESRPSGTGTTSGSVGEDDSVAVGAGANGTLRIPADAARPTTAVPQGRVADRTVTGGTRIEERAERSRRPSGDAVVDAALAKRLRGGRLRQRDRSAQPRVALTGE